jgi:DNA mismatch repair ATPase MutL
MYDAWARILDERLIVGQDVDQGNQADLLAPEQIPPEHAEVIMLHSEHLRELGFDIEDLGLAGALVRNVPKILPKIDIQQFLLLFSARLLLGENFQSSLRHSILNSIEYLDNNNPNYAMLDEMARSASATRIDLISLSVLLDGEFMARGLER